LGDFERLIAIRKFLNNSVLDWRSGMDNINPVVAGKSNELKRKIIKM
jgi:hypothetical protein